MRRQSSELMAQIAPDFHLLDVWDMPAEGGRDDFGRLVEIVTSFDPAKSDSTPTRALFALRFRIGALLHWDDPSPARPTLQDRVPVHLRNTATTPPIVSDHGFVPLYRTDDEWAAEISNATVHGVLHLAWVDRHNGRYGGQLSVYVKPRGMLGRGYLALISPFRHLVVYPALLRQIGRAWNRQPRPVRSPR